jgi:HSP20 family protein
MARDLIRLMHSLFLPGADRVRQPVWHPSVDVYRTRKGWLVKFDLAGVRLEDISLTANRSLLTVQGTRRDCSTAEGCSFYRMEIAYSRFERSVELPFEPDPSRITSEYRDGMLLVYIEAEADE